jgi:hypothetical protein
VGLIWDLVKHDTGINVPGSAASGDAAPAPGSLGTVGLRVSRLHMTGSPDFPPPPIDWTWVGDEDESACSQVTATERLLYETLALVVQNILRLIHIGLKKEKKFASAPLASFMHSHPILHFVSTAPVLGQCGHVCDVGSSDPGVGCSRCCGSCPRRGGTCCKDFCSGGCCGMR